MYQLLLSCPKYFCKNILFFYTICCCCCSAASVVSDSVRPQRWQPTRLPRPWDSPGKNTGVGCHFLLQCVKVKSQSEVAQLCLTQSTGVGCHCLLQCMKVKSQSEVAQLCPTLRDPMDCNAAYQAPLSMGFSRQEYWNGLPLPFITALILFNLYFIGIFPFSLNIESIYNVINYSEA